MTVSGSRWIRCATRSISMSCGRPVPRHGSAGERHLGWPPGTRDEAYRLQGELAEPVARGDGSGCHRPGADSADQAEPVVSAWRRSFFEAGGPLLASVRVGNVIGGGDWATDRLLPDLVRAFEAGAAPLIRAPDAVRPWQHVLEALGGYLMIAERLLA